MRKLIQLTDLHVGLEGEETYGVDVRQNFVRAIDAVKAKSPDQIIVTGDLCYQEGKQPIYEWIKSQLDATSIPYLVISGNHDNPSLMSEVFGLSEDLHEGKLYYQTTIGNFPALFLDSTTGVIDEEQLGWLNKTLAGVDRPVLLFIHHPPFISGVPYMDTNYALQNRAELLECLFAYPHQIWAFSGHYHVDKIITKFNVTSYITPSCFFQIDQSSDSFKVDHYRVGFREIILNGSKLMNAVHYF